MAQHWQTKVPLWQSTRVPNMRMARETQIHMFQCREPKSIEEWATAFTTMTNYYHEKSIPAWVSKPFILMCKNIWNINLDDPVHRDIPTVVQEATKKQQQLGPEFLLRGYLIQEWLTAIQHFDKDKPQLRLTHLYLGLRKTLFATVWEQRNATTNSEVSIVYKIEGNQFTWLAFCLSSKSKGELGFCTNAKPSKLAHTQPTLSVSDFS